MDYYIYKYIYNRDTDSRHIQDIGSGPRQYGQKIKTSKTSSAINNDEAEPGFDAKNELDTSADTICTGANWRLLSASFQWCDINGFHKLFKGIKDVPIARLATGTHDKNGNVHILIVNQALYFGASLDHSLINPNQIRHFRILVSDNLYDSGQYLGIDHDNQLIPFKTEGSTVCFQIFSADGCWD